MKRGVRSTVGLLFLVCTILFTLTATSYAATIIDDCRTAGKNNDIETPGEYVINQSFTNLSVAGCITIMTSNVSIDGNGTTIIVNGTGASDGKTDGFVIGNESAAVENITIFNLTILNYTNAGIRTKNVSHLTLYNMTFNDSETANNAPTGFSHETEASHTNISSCAFYSNLPDSKLIDLGSSTKENITVADSLFISLGDNETNFGIQSTGGLGNSTIINNNMTNAANSSSSALISISSGGSCTLCDWNNTVNNTFINTNITTTNDTAYGIKLLSLGFSGTPDNNSFVNTTISSVNASFYDDTGAAFTNDIIYSNGYSKINWSQINVTTNMSLELGVTVFLEEHKAGLRTSKDSINLNNTAELEFYDLSFATTPRLLKDGVACADGLDLCNVTYDDVNGILYANISSFSNYTLESNDTTESSSSSSSSSSDSSPGAGGSSGVGVKVANSLNMIWSLIYKDEKVTVNGNDNVGFEEIIFTVTRDVKGPQLKIERLDSIPLGETTSFDRFTFRILEFTPKNFKIDDFGSIHIRSKVEQSWLTENNLDKDDVAMFRHTTEWVELPTTITAEDLDYLYLQTETPGFSYFIIGEKERPIVPETTKGEAETQPAAEIPPKELTKPEPAAADYRLEGWHVPALLAALIALIIVGSYLIKRKH